MILTGQQIIEEVKNGRITISPFQITQVTTNSYDLRLDSEFVEYLDLVLDPRVPPQTKTISIPSGESIEFSAGDFKLGSSIEIIGSDHFVPIIHAKSGIARLGLFVHVTADLIDIGFVGKTTFQLYATLPISITPNMLIAQVSFWVPDGPIDLYNGKYQHAEKPMASQISHDFL